MNLLLDTCAIIWAIAYPDRLSSTARQLITAPENAVFISPISAAEIACACDRGRLVVRPHWKPWLRHFLGVNGWEVHPIDLPIAEEAYSLPGDFHADPADRIITATSRILNASLLTADRKILDYPHVTAIW